MNKENVDSVLIKRAKDNDSNALVQLTSKYERVYFNVLRKILRPNSLLFNDAVEDKYLFFYETVKNYNSDRGSSFMTFTHNCATWRILNLLRKEKKKIEINDFELYNHNEQNSNQLDSIIYFIQDFDEKTRYIFNRRLFPDNKKPTSFQKIGKELGISHEQARIIYKKHIKILKEKLLKNEKNNI